MAASFQRVSGRERLRLWWALAFWAATYLLFLTWNQLQDEFPTAVWQTRRLLATLFGAIAFFAFTWLADRVAARPLRERGLILLGAGLACCVAVAVGRAAIDWLVVSALGEASSSVERHIRFALIWAGYFAGGALAFLSFAPATGSGEDAESVGPAPARPEPPGFPDALWVSRGRETVRIPVAAIAWIEAEGDYVRLHAEGGGGLMRGTLSGLEATLDPAVFARVHRSAICRRSAVAAMLRKPSGAIAVRLDTGAEVPVGRRYRDAVAGLIGTDRRASA